jgi:heavy metal sensor kinase
MKLSLRSRLTLWYTLVLVVVLCVFGVGIVWMEGRIAVRGLDRELSEIEETIRKIVANEMAEQLTPAEAATEATETVADENLATAVLDAQGASLSSNLDDADLDTALGMPEHDVTATVRTASRSWRVLTRVEKIGGASFRLVVAKPMSDIERGQRELREAIVIGIPVALLLAGAGGWWLASIGLAPITRMADRAVRLPLTGSDDLGEPARQDELGQLTQAFNGLVGRLRAALKTQRQFMADASHELRTPVSIIRSAAEVTLSRDQRSESEYRETITTARDQSLRLGRLVEDMLVLARADAGGYPIHPIDLDLDEIVDECRRAVKMLASERCVHVQSSAGPEVPIRGDADLLRRLLLNLLQNAIQHTSSGGSVIVTTEPAPDIVRVRVSDGGPGIPEADRTRIFDRFVRLDEARTGNGTGLGLPIAKWIAEAHGGTLVLEASGPAGSTFCATLRRAG